MAYVELGKRLQELRLKKHRTIADVARAVKHDRSYLSKLEKGRGRPSIEVLNSIVKYYALSDTKLIKEIFTLAGHQTPIVTFPDSQEITQYEQKQVLNQPGNMQMKIPDNLPILYTDGVYITSSQYGLVLDFAQNVGPTNNQTVIARLGMSKEHARVLAQTLMQRVHEDKEQQTQVKPTVRSAGERRGKDK